MLLNYFVAALGLKFLESCLIWFQIDFFTKCKSFQCVVVRLFLCYGSHSGHDKLDPNRGFLTPTPTNKKMFLLLKSFLTIYVLGIWCIIPILDWRESRGHCKKWHEINLLSGYHLFPLKKILLSAEKKLLFQIAVRSGGGWLTIFDVPNVGTGVIMIHVYG